MTYESNAKHSKVTQTIVLVIIFQLIMNIDHNSFVPLYIGLLFFLIAFLTIFLQYKVKINKTSLSYQINLMNRPIYSKEVSADQIKQMNFKRYSWSTRGAVIQLKKGMNIRIISFPSECYAELISFANGNGVSISKSKDYQILEKLD